MESVDNLPSFYTTPNIQQQTFIHVQNPTPSSKQEKETLIKKIELLMLHNKTLEQKKISKGL